MAEHQGSELSWLPLGDIEYIDDILAAPADFTNNATFGRDERGLEYCTADGVSDVASPIFKTIRSPRKNYELRGNALRLRPGTTTLMSRSAYIILVKVWGKNATIENVELTLRSMAHFMKDIQIKVEDDSVVDVFYVVENPKKGTIS